MSEFLSDHLKSTRDALKAHVHGGKIFTSEEIIGLVGRLDEMVAMARLQENEISRDRWNDAARRENAMDSAPRNCRCVVTKPTGLPDNVITFPGARASGHPGGEGGAA